MTLRSLETQSLLLLATLVARVPAQAPPIRQPLDSGTLLRVYVPGDSVIRGRTVVRFAPGDSVLSLCRFPGPPCTRLNDPDVLSWPVSSIEHVEVARGTDGSVGAVVGLLLGAALGTSIGQICIDGPCPSTAHAMLHTGLPFAAVFALVGWGVSSGHPHWVRVQ